MPQRYQMERIISVMEREMERVDFFAVFGYNLDRVQYHTGATITLQWKAENTIKNSLRVIELNKIGSKGDVYRCPLR